MGSEDRAMQVFFDIHDDIPRGGPGSRASTGRAFGMLDQLRESPVILDIGCGPGRQTLDLAGLSGGSIIAVDNHEAFLKRLSEEVKRYGLQDRVTVIKGDMLDLGFAPGTFDAIWAEGAIYIIGFERGLRQWRSLLREGGYVAVTEVSWLRPDPPEELAAFWKEQYPAIQSIEENEATLCRCGYRPVGQFILPESDWWDHYYTPILEKISTLRQKYTDDPVAIEVIQMEEREIGLYRRYSGYNGYVFYVAQID